VLLLETQDPPNKEETTKKTTKVKAQANTSKMFEPIVVVALWEVIRDRMNRVAPPDQANAETDFRMAWRTLLFHTGDLVPADVMTAIQDCITPLWVQKLIKLAGRLVPLEDLLPEQDNHNQNCAIGDMYKSVLSYKKAGRVFPDGAAFLVKAAIAGHLGPPLVGEKELRVEIFKSLIVLLVSACDVVDIQDARLGDLELELLVIYHMFADVIARRGDNLEVAIERAIQEIPVWEFPDEFFP
jgi:hypothetical protein